MHRFGSGLSTAHDATDAVAEAFEAARAGLDGAVPTLALAFASTHHGDASLARRLAEATGAAHLIGCIGETVVGKSREVEREPALSLWLAHLPDPSVESFRIEVNRTEEAFQFRGHPELTPGESDAGGTRSLLVIGDPFSFPADHWLDFMNRELPGLPVFGGMASGGTGPGTSRLFHGPDVVDDGAAGVVLDGVPVRTIVSQGCRPVGRPMVITRAHDNVIDEVAGQPPLAMLQQLFEDGSDEEKALIQRAAGGGGLHIGQVVDEHISQPGRGDFLVRNVVGADNETGAMMISDWARVGCTVCFHVRDAESADEDLNELLASAPGDSSGGAVLFSCNGRGTRLFDVENHDASCIERHLGAIPLAGFFAAGEIGPVGGKNFVHGFTASVAVYG